MLHMLAAFAEHEREMISQRTKATIEPACARGARLGNPRWQEAPEKARAAVSYVPVLPVVSGLMAALSLKSASLQDIATHLNDLCISAA